eukprot:1631081-Pleurochrysis_carterae.AAC.3
MSTKQREEKRSPCTAMHRGVEGEGDHGKRQVLVTQVMSVAYKKIRNALDALLFQSIRLRIIR